MIEYKTINMRTKLGDCYIATRIYRSLYKNKIRTFGDLIKLYNKHGDYEGFKKDLKKINGIGDECVSILNKFLYTHCTIKYL